MFKRLEGFLKKRIFRYMESYEVTMDELKHKQNDGAVIVDVRSSQEYQEDGLKEAINIPEYEINSDVDKILKDKDAEIILYCSTGNRSKSAYKKLISLGYKNVYNLYGGLNNW